MSHQTCFYVWTPTNRLNMCRILYENDWNLPDNQDAIVQWDTKNVSFKDYALLLRSMGIRNWKWPLALLNQDLEYIDPFSPDLTIEQKMMIAAECKNSPWYHFREITRIPGSTLDNPIYFLANRSNMSLFWLYFNHISVCLEQLRQTGKTFAVNTLDAYLLNISSIGGRTLLLTKDDKLRAETLTEIKSIFDLFPDYLHHHARGDIANREEINVEFFDNNYKGLIAQNNPIAADKTGRGHKIENTRTDEAAYLFYIEIAIRTMLAATDAAVELAKKKGIPYGNIFMSTSGKKDDRDGEYMYNYFHNAAYWSEGFLDCKDEIELEKVIRVSSKDSKTLRVHAVFSHRMLGRTDEWLIETATKNGYVIGSDPFLRDYMNQWTSGSQNSPFTVDEAKRVRDSQRDVAKDGFMDISKHGSIVTRWYIPEDRVEQIMNMEHTVCGVDTSDGMGRDDIALHIRNLRTGDTIASSGINEINLMTVAEFLVDLLFRFPKMTMIIESRSSARAIIDFMHKKMIIKRMDPFRRLFNVCVQEHVAYPERYEEIQKGNNAFSEAFLEQYKKFFGFATSSSGSHSRSELYGTTMRAAVKFTGDLVKDKPTINQLLALIIKNGRVDHPPGGHDDLCVAWLLTYWFMSLGRNLQYYGIPSGYVLSANTLVNSSVNKEELYQAALSQKAKNRVGELIDQIKAERDPNVVERLLFEVEAVKSFLGPQHEVSVSVDDMIAKLKKEKMIKGFAKRSLFG